ncbi:tyrosine-type recombinase/integrase [Halomicroarcula sp. GCM10025817]|uniref:site-specific integrase n=1 Tax=Haloarcula TaxID=2237 RepID=UPI0023E8D0DE|nr:site-specific integrase [Halomicroarcula sp. SYNS111]
MRTVRNKDGTWNVWMSRDEYRELPRATDTFQQEIALRLMGDCGLRVAEVLDVTPAHISRRSDGQHFELEVVAGKDTTGEYRGGKHRETWLPREFEAQINRYQQEKAIADQAPLVDRAKRTVQDWVDRAADRAAENTGDSDYRRVSSHDLRRCWANHLLVEENVSPRIVMALGGWSSYDAIEPYLAAPTESNINRSMSQISL